ncbi:unnamed protein product [Calicophoron daubneyi]|uniref:Scavenger receptor class B member 1 n=1 Tax=Calicophoron daubneyi TaxID=300641 RepID=A0AAV2T210_CALDB
MHKLMLTKTVMLRCFEMLQSKRLRMLLATLAILLMLLGIGCLTVTLLFNKLFYRMLSNYLVLLPDSEFFKTWSKPSVPIYFSVYLYNLTNPTDVLDGDRPHFSIVGPYVYRERRQTNVVGWSDEPVPKSVFYKSRTFYHFVPELSASSDRLGKVTSLNMPYLKSKELFEPFVTLSPREVLWEHRPMLLQFAGFFGFPTNAAILASFNGTEGDVIGIDTGARDVNEIGQIRSVNGKNKLKAWDYDEANRIVGTDGSLAPPYLDVGSILDVYVRDVCRTFRIQSNKRQPARNNQDVDIIVFSAFPFNQTDPHLSLRERMYCKNGMNCGPVGMVSARPCLVSKGTDFPLYFSKPYFLDVDPSVKAKFDGIPDAHAETHDTSIHIEPTTGLVLEANKRIQFNFLLENDNEMLRHINGPFYFPVAWVDESVVADKENLDLLYSRVLQPKRIIPFVASVFALFFVLLSLTIFAALVTFARARVVYSLSKTNDLRSPTSSTHTSSSSCPTEFEWD